MQLGLLLIITVHMWPMIKPTITGVACHQKKFSLDKQVEIREKNRHLFLLRSQRA
jgi:hypothetical protein